MVLIIDFGQPVQEILQNNYLKTNLKSQKLEIFSPHFVSPQFHKGEIFFKKYPVFRILNGHISITVDATVFNQAILKFFIKDFHLMALRAFKYEVEKMAWDPYLNFAETKIQIAEDDKKIIHHSRKSLLFDKGSTWLKKGGIFVV